MVGSGGKSRKRKQHGLAHCWLPPEPSTCRQGSDPGPGREERGLSHRGVRAAARWVDQASGIIMWTYTGQSGSGQDGKAQEGPTLGL